jgi:hypothetical protein
MVYSWGERSAGKGHRACAQTRRTGEPLFGKGRPVYPS